MANVTSSIQLKRHTGSTPTRPIILNEGEFAIDFADNGHLYYGGGGLATNISSSFTFNSLRITGSPSYALEVTGSTNIQGNLIVKGTGSFDVFVTSYESSSIIYSSGSTKFGDDIDDTHEFTGSIYVSGNLTADFGTGSFSVVSASSYIGVQQVEYQTGSAPKADLTTLKILDFDPNVFVTSDSTTGELVLQFGESNIPTLTFDENNYSPNRFSLNTDSYSVTSSFDDVAGVTYYSHSFIVHLNGQDEVLETIQLNSSTGAPLSHSMVSSGRPISSGSYNNDWVLTSSLHIKDGAGAFRDIVTHSGDLLELNKTNPTDGAITWTYSTLPTDYLNYITNPQQDTSNSNIEQGLTGSIVAVITLNATSNQWFGLPYAAPTGSFSGGTAVGGGGDLDSISADNKTFQGSFTTSSTLSTFNLASRYTSSQGGTPEGEPQSAYISHSVKAFNRIITPRVGFSANSSSLSEVDFNNLDRWVNGSEIEDGQLINFPTSNPNNVSFTADVTSTDKFLYIIYDDNQSDLTEIVQSNQNVLDQFTGPTTAGDYKYYRSTNKVVAPNTFTAELKTS
jgi:hypothetical protein